MYNRGSYESPGGVYSVALVSLSLSLCVNLLLLLLLLIVGYWKKLWPFFFFFFLILKKEKEEKEEKEEKKKRQKSYERLSCVSCVIYDRFIPPRFSYGRLHTFTGIDCTREGRREEAGGRSRVEGLCFSSQAIIIHNMYK